MRGSKSATATFGGLLTHERPLAFLFIFSGLVPHGSNAWRGFDPKGMKNSLGMCPAEFLLNGFVFIGNL